jgi:hypothetical protein
MASLEPLGFTDLRRTMCCAGQCRTGRPRKPENPHPVRKSEVALLKGPACVDMGVRSSISSSVDVRASAVVQWFRAAGGLLLGKAPENRSDLADHLGIDSVSKAQRTVVSVGMRVIDEHASLQSAGAT